MRRREFITTLGGAVLSLPLQVRAQQSSMPVIGYLGTRLVEQELFNNAFRRGLKEMGLVEGQNVTIEYLPEGDLQRLPEFVADMVRRRVSVIFTSSNVGALAAKAATSDIPIVFVVGLDPVAVGLVSSINRPGATPPAFHSGSAHWSRSGSSCCAISCLRCHSLARRSTRTIQMPQTM